MLRLLSTLYQMLVTYGTNRRVYYLIGISFAYLRAETVDPITEDILKF